MFIGFVFTSGSKDAIRKTKGGRRFCVFFTTQQDDGEFSYKDFSPSTRAAIARNRMASRRLERDIARARAHLADCGILD